ncbi:GNAT family N-acetyltransferase [Pseudomonas sp. 148P]|uniref:GNAT family N-acetyltransferase n=1 Tax=Pseudomonas ulcerans TaxID=3115852 RepID=A0ABU7HQR4_9PSED|nr:MULTISPECIES: GNAT family N-acetyltransferase [unclassified Pseudomonas]MEE1925403.1 GNAT family N-acetyltransferase [Pseudomonas sp. 147P]MEE1933857.1 GNAT family N-acetyltransferase [Pseudomonas sp. 148P]
MNLTITPVAADEYPALTTLWEASVRATHDFLPEAHIERLRPLILNDYLAAVELRAARDATGALLGFAGVHEGKLEMLFIDPARRGTGVGKALLAHAIAELGVSEVDVNEQNPQAVGFYLHQGFHVTGRSELDGQSEPFPLLHLNLVAPQGAA